MLIARNIWKTHIDCVAKMLSLLIFVQAARIVTTGLSVGTDISVSCLHIVCDYGTSSSRLSLTYGAQCPAPTTTKATTTSGYNDDDVLYA